MPVYKITRSAEDPIRLGEWLAAAGQVKGLRLHAESSVMQGATGEPITVKQIRGDLDLLQPNSLWRRLTRKPRLWVDAFDFDAVAGTATFKARSFPSKAPISTAAASLASLLGATVAPK